MPAKLNRAFKIDFEKLRKNGGTGFFVFDLLMLFIVGFNLSWIFFDISFRFDAFQNLVYKTWPAFYEFYAHKIHPNFIFYDMIFVAIFITELLFRWAIAIAKKEYDKWFFYPFIHWYDVLGCIPLSGFRMLRFLRVFSMVYRLNRMGVIDLQSTWGYKQFMKYTSVVVEEVSDRVVVNVLNGVQDEVQKGNPVVGKIISDVVIPKQDQIIDWSSKKMGELTTEIFEKYSGNLRIYLENVVSRAVKENKEIQRIRLIPGVGKIVAEILDNSISDITYNAIKESIEDIGHERNKDMMKQISEQVLTKISSETDSEADELFKTVISDSIEVIKSEVEVKQWKLKEEIEKQKKVERKFEKELLKKNKKKYLEHD